MATKIKLEVNHGNHAKQESGQKITIPNDKSKDQNKQKEQIKQVKPNPPQKTVTKTTKQGQKEKKNEKNTIGKQQKQQNKDQKSPSKESPKKQQGVGKKQVKDKQLQTLQRIKMTEQKTKLTIEELIDQYKDAADDIFINHGHNDEKQRVIAEKLTKLQKQKQSRQKKLQQLQEKSLNKSMNKQKADNEQEERKRQQRQKRRRKRAERKLENLRALSEQRLERQKKYEEYYNNEYKAKVFRFKKYEQQFKQRQKENEQKIKEKLMKNKQKYKPMNAEEFEDFLDQYEHNKWSMLEQSQKKRQFNKQMIQNQNKELMAKLWRGECHRKVKQQRQRQQNMKNEGKTKLLKTKQYGTIVKDSFKPKISQEKRNRSLNISLATNIFNQHQIENIDGKQYLKVARQKYANGVNQGLVIQKLRKSLDHNQQVKKGNQYLQYLRKLPKAPKQTPQPIQQKAEQNPEQSRRKTPSTTFKPKILRNPYYQNPHSDRITSKSAALNQKRIKDPEVFNYLVADMKARSREIELQQKAIKYGRYNGILELQGRHHDLNKKLVQGISQKLSILSKM